jgi:hypothetical protein
MCSSGCGGGRVGADGQRVGNSGKGCVPVGFEVNVGGRIMRWLTEREARAAGPGQEPTPVCR